MLRSLFGGRNRAHVTVERFTTPFRDISTVASIASIYQHVFGDDPWFEGYTCPMCHSCYPRNFKKRTCDNCEPEHTILLVEYWPRHGVIRDFYKEMCQPNAKCMLAKSDEGIVGFAWGYDMDVDHNACQKLDAPGLCQHLSGRYFYVDEVAVLLSYRAKGVGKQLTSQLIEGQEVGRVFYRTLGNSPMHRLGEKLGGHVVQHISEGRVIIAI